MAKFPMTEAGKNKLEQELTYLKTVKRNELVERIKTARSFCDFSEDSEYDEAVKKQASIEERILMLEQMLQNVEIIELDNQRTYTIKIGHSVTFMELPNGPEETYTIVGTAEADPLEGKISNDSPMAKSLLGHKVNDEIKVNTPDGKMSVKITKIS